MLPCMLALTRAEKNTFLSRWILPALLILTVVYDVHHASYLFQYMTGKVNLVAPPFRVIPGTSRIDSLSPEAQNAGLERGDNLLRVNGSRYDGSAVTNRIFQHAHLGDSLSVTVARSRTNVEISVPVQLVPRGRPPSDRWYVLVSIFTVLPFTCQFLGFFTVWKRPSSRPAWLIFALALAFGNLIHLGSENVDGAFLSNFALVSGQYLGATLGCWLLLLACDFPQPLSYGRRLRRLSWVLAYPLFGAALFRVVARLFDLNNYWAASPLQPFSPAADSAWRWLTVLAVVSFLGLMFARFFEPSTPDSHRRVRLLFFGTAVAILPLLFLIVSAQQTGRPLDSYPVQIIVPALLTTLFFPLTLAFVVMVPRAPEVGALVRQVLLRALLQSGLIALQISAAAVYLIVVLRSAGSLRNALFGYTLAFILIVLILQPSVVEQLRLWADRRFFAKAFADEQQLEHLAETLTLSGDADLMLSAAESRLSRVLGVERAHIILNGHRTHGYSEDAKLLIAPGSDLSASLTSQKPTVIYFDQPNSYVHRLRSAEQAQLRTLQTRVIVPVSGKDGLAGIISLGPKRFDIPYTRSELVLLQFTASQVSLAVQNSDLASRIAAEASARERIKAEKDAMEKASEAKSAFLASMSHELRTPMTAIIGYTEILLEQAEDDGDESTIADLKTIHSAGKHLLELINSVLDISKIEAGKMEVYYEAFSVSELVQNVVSLTKPLIQDKNNQLVLKCETNVGFMDSDRIKVRQALFNLISNASKFTERGIITVSVARSSTNGEDWVTFTVADTGIGMTAEQVEKLFQAFSQADSSIGSKYGGTGLGLSLTKKFCELLSGSISVESQYGSGTTFTMRLPAGGREATSLEPSVDEAGGNETSPLVLVIDDDPAVHQFVSRSLEKRKIRVIATSDGEYGLALAKRYRPQAIILDIIMQKIDGWQVLSRLKSDPDVSTIPVLVLTVLENRSAAQALGATDYLVKPVDRERLLKLLSTYCSRASSHDRRSCVLVVDDDPANRAILRKTIESCGLDILEAQGGREALSIVSETTPDLILLDLNMPGMDGFEFMEALNGNPQTAQTPIIVVTAKDLNQEERSRLAGRASHVMERRSHSPEELIEAVNEQLARYFVSSQAI
jgi:signal transduction histidine kinase/CheY-like chemotaxis protein